MTTMLKQIPQNIQGFEYRHPSMIKLLDKYAGAYAKLKLAEYEMLKEDISINGILQPVTVSASGLLLDGHNRYYAAIDLGIEIPVIVLKEIATDMEERIVIGINLVRRQLKATQRQHLLSTIFPGIVFTNKKGIDYNLAKRYGMDVKQLKKDEAIVKKASTLELATTGQIMPSEESIEAVKAADASPLKAYKDAYNKETSAVKMKETASILTSLARAIGSKDARFEMSLENILIVQPAIQKCYIAINQRISDCK